MELYHIQPGQVWANRLDGLWVTVKYVNVRIKVEGHDFVGVIVYTGTESPTTYQVIENEQFIRSYAKLYAKGED